MCGCITRVPIRTARPRSCTHARTHTRTHARTSSDEVVARVIATASGCKWERHAVTGERVSEVCVRACECSEGVCTACTQHQRCERNEYSGVLWALGATPLHRLQCNGRRRRFGSAQRGGCSAVPRSVPLRVTSAASARASASCTRRRCPSLARAGRREQSSVRSADSPLARRQGKARSGLGAIRGVPECRRRECPRAS